MSQISHAPRGNGSEHRANMPPFDRNKVAAMDRATPDLDTAVISSEDEHDTSNAAKPFNTQAAPPGFPKAQRRISFLNELQPDPKRKHSLPGFSAPNNSAQPPTPAVESSSSPWAFGSSLTKVPSNGSASGWSIWGNSQIGHPLSPAVSNTDNELTSGSPLSLRDTEEIPFAIPMYPTPKTYRSQSYSVGQMESDADDVANESPASGRGKPNQVKMVKHKPSKLSEVEHATTLEELNEGDDEGSDNGVPLGSPQMWNRNSVMNMGPAQQYTLNNNMALPPPHGLKEALSLATNDQRNLNNALQLGASGRPQWHTTQTFEHAQEPPASRRHSMADVTLNRGQIAGNAQSENNNVTGAFAGEDMTSESFRRQASSIEQNMVQDDLKQRDFAAGYFSGSGPAARSQHEAGYRPPEPANVRMSAGPYRQGPSAAVFNRPGFDTPLYIVGFKCARADIYYVQPGTGLEVNEGDMVMVEADRGYDLGTVTHARVSWPRARELKEKSLDEQFRWLMMFSRHNQEVLATDPKAANGLLAQQGPTERDPLQKGFGLGMHDVAYSHDIKPRMIKRKAFNYEIANLREKEGNEAKAKRTCQQKAREHNCKMEILDAEFQIDWKKLTFYFYAPDYINFNPLVTELYKIYKVRIWMSAINPGTYPSTGNKPPSSIGPGAMEGRDTPMDQVLNSLNDPDPAGAIPPHLNPASTTYKELNKEAAAREQGSQDAFHPINPAAFQQGHQQRSHGSPRFPPPASHFQHGPNQAVWGTMNFPNDPQRATQGPAAFGNGQNFGQFAQAMPGAEFRPAANRHPSTPQNFGRMGQPPMPSPGMNAARQGFNPWNANPTGAAPRDAAPLAPPAALGGLGGDWMSRGFGNLNLGPDRK